jgi:hypothetical protein
VDELLPVIALGLGALLFAQKSNAAPMNPYASIPSGAMTMGGMSTPLMGNAGLYGTQPIQQYGAQPYTPNYINTPAYQQLQAQNGLVNLAGGVINKLPNNLFGSGGAGSPSVAGQVGSIATGQAASAAADAVLNSATNEAAARAASDAAAQAAVEQAAAQAAAEQAATAAAADAASAAAADAAASSAFDAAAVDVAESSLWDTVVGFAADSWYAW